MSQAPTGEFSPKPQGDYEQVLAALYATRGKGIELGISRVRRCLEELGLQKGGAPHVVQIAGTNGKGSTAHYLASILRAAGVRVGVFSSPHLMSLCERFVIEGASVTRSELVAAYRSTASTMASLSFFEQVTVMAAWLFRSREVEVAIYEVGLGGRLDSTTAIDAEVSVVTGIALDHCEYLGSDIADIAHEKAGAFRRGGHAIVGLSAPPKIREQLARRAQELGAIVSMVEKTHIDDIPDELTMAGEHQRENAASAVAAARALQERGVSVPEPAIAAGLQEAGLAGRLQEVESGLWIDGAHNAQASQALASTITGQGPWVMVVGLSVGKPVAEFLAPLEKHGALLIATEASNERACAAQIVADAALGFETVEVQATPEQALRRAREVAEGRPILVTGSLLLLGEVLQQLGHGPADPFLVSDPGAKRST